MSDTDQPLNLAWEPLTPRGVAAFARSSFTRLAVFQFGVALLAAASVIWFLYTAWFPVIRGALPNLPDAGEITGQHLDWKGASPVQLSQNHFLGFSVDLLHSGRLGREPHLQVEFGKDDFRIYAPLNYLIVQYPAEMRIGFNRGEFEPWWGAWHPFILLGVAISVILLLTVQWPILATVYCLPVWLISFFEDRDLGFLQSWRLAAAATMPGILFLTLGIIGYGLGWIDLIRLGGVAVLNFVVGWIYLFVSPLCFPRTSTAAKTKANPFASKEKKSDQPE